MRAAASVRRVRLQQTYLGDVNIFTVPSSSAFQRLLYDRALFHRCQNISPWGGLSRQMGRTAWHFCRKRRPTFWTCHASSCCFCNAHISLLLCIKTNLFFSGKPTKTVATRAAPVDSVVHENCLWLGLCPRPTIKLLQRSPDTITG